MTRKELLAIIVLVPVFYGIFLYSKQGVLSSLNRGDLGTIKEHLAVLYGLGFVLLAMIPAVQLFKSLRRKK